MEKRAIIAVKRAASAIGRPLSVLKKRIVIASSVQVIGIVSISGGLYLIRTWAGLIGFGIGAVVFGVGIERSDIEVRP